jgi:peptide/nickel transport system permease protein
MLKKLKNLNARERMLMASIFSCVLLLVIFFLSFSIGDSNLRANAKAIDQAPSLSHLFGTDWLGRDMLARTMKGLRLSLTVGIIASAISVLISVILGVASAVMGETVDSVISWVTDLFIGMPHLIFMLLICFMMGGGVKGIIVGVSLTHWSLLARIIRAEVLQFKNADYIQISSALGRSIWYIAWRHVIPYIMPQIIIRFLSVFPHAIVHEAAVTFLGFGFSPQTPAIGVILSEAMSHISTGKWWLVLFPGLLLVLVAKSFDSISEQAHILLEPASAHE